MTIPSVGHDRGLAILVEPQKGCGTGMENIIREII